MAEDLPCVECKRAGRPDVLMKYEGVQYESVHVAVAEFDDAAPNGERQFDIQTCLPFASWRCSYDHNYTEGY